MPQFIKNLINSFKVEESRAIEVFAGVQGAFMTTGSLVLSNLYPGTLWLLTLIALTSYLHIYAVIVNSLALRHYSSLILFAACLGYVFILTKTLPYSYFEFIFYLAIAWTNA